MKMAPVAALVLSFFTCCSAATSVEDDADLVEDEGCHFTYEDDSGRVPFECVVPSDSEETCLDAGLCYCHATHPDGSEEAIDACMAAEILPRAMATLSDFCWDGVPMSLAEALSSWAADRGAIVVTDDACDDLLATLSWP